MNATTETRTETITLDLGNDVKHARTLDALIGRQAVYTTFEGERLVGIVTSHDGHFARVTFPNGKWARLDSTIELVIDETPSSDECPLHGAECATWVTM